MKPRSKEGRTFDISAGERPKVLLLGNGIARAFYETKSWNELIEKIQDKNKFPLPAEQYKMPLPLKIDMLANGHDFEHDKNFNYAMRRFEDNDQSNTLINLLNLDFDYILTTNYTYEIEYAVKEDNQPFLYEDLEKYKLPTQDEENSIIKYHYQIPTNSKEYSIWHIHGEVLPKNHSIINHYEYGKLLSTYIRHFSSKKINQPKVKIYTWLDAFILGDVYIVGFGMDFSEIDLWWLLEQKAINKKDKGIAVGTTTFFEPTEQTKDTKNQKPPEVVDANECKKSLLEIYGVSVENLNFTVNDKEKDYPRFYQKVLNWLKEEFYKNA